MRVHGCWLWEAAQTKDQFLIFGTEGPQRALALPPWFFTIIMYAESAAKGGLRQLTPYFTNEETSFRKFRDLLKSHCP